MTIIGGHIESPWPALAAHRAKLAAVGMQRVTEVTAEWEAVRAQLPPDAGLGTVLLAVLDLHKPYLSDGSDTPDCRHCCTGAFEVESMPWPCETYETIRDSLMGEDGRHD